MILGDVVFGGVEPEFRSPIYDRHEIAYVRCRIFRCALCWRVISWDDGCDGDSLCTRCWCAMSPAYKEPSLEGDIIWSWPFETVVTPKARGPV